MAITLACSGATTVNLNDGVNTFIEIEGVNLGNRQTTWEEIPSYAGSNVQVNIRRGSLIPVTIPMRVKDTSIANLNTRLSTLWTTVETCSTTVQGTLTWDSESYSIVYSTRPDTIYRDQWFQLSFLARFTLVLMRTP